MDEQTFRSKVKEYTEEAIKDLKEAKEINDIEQQCAKVSFDVRKHKEKLEGLKRGKPEYISYYENYLPFNLDKYEKKIRKLEDYWGEVAKKSNKNREQNQKEKQNQDHQLKASCCAWCKSKPPTNHYIYSTKNKELKPRKRDADPYKKEYLFCSEEHFEKWHQKNYYCCAECTEEQYDSNYKKNKKDGQKFCSDNCYYQHYAETCDNCLEKCVSSYQGKATGRAQTYYSDGINKTGTLCSKCYGEKLKEETEEKKNDKKWEECWKKVDKSMDDLVDGMEEVLAGQNEENLDNSDKDNSNNDVDSNNSIDKQQIQSRQQQLNTEISNLENKPNRTQQEEQELVNKKQKLKELEEKLKDLENKKKILVRKKIKVIMLLFILVEV